MAQQLQSINLVAPAFKGINTEDSPLAQDPSFADVADNAVIDKRGRIASRKGNLVITTNKTELGSAKIRAIKEFEDNAGNTKVFSALSSNSLIALIFAEPNSVLSVVITRLPLRDAIRPRLSITALSAMSANEGSCASGESSVLIPLKAVSYTHLTLPTKRIV